MVTTLFQMRLTWKNMLQCQFWKTASVRYRYYMWLNYNFFQFLHILISFPVFTWTRVKHCPKASVHNSFMESRFEIKLLSALIPSSRWVLFRNGRYLQFHVWVFTRNVFWMCLKWSILASARTCVYCYHFHLLLLLSTSLFHCIFCDPSSHATCVHAKRLWDAIS